MDRLLRARGVVVAALVGIFVCGLLVRVVGTSERTFFWDEAYHLELVLLPTIGEMLAAILANPPSDPLYALLLRGWAALVGTSDVSLRLPSAVFGAATALATAWLAWELTRNRLVVLLAAFLVAIAPYAVEFGQEASLYAFATFWVTLALAAGWRWRGSGRRSDGALAVFLAVIAVYSHYVAPVALGLAAVLSVSRFAGPRQISGRDMGLAVVVVVIAWVPWLAPMVASWMAMDYPRSSIAHTASVTELFGALSQYSSGSGALLERVRPLQVLGLASAAVLIGRGWFVGRDVGARGVRILIVVAAILFLVPWVGSAISGRWLFVAHLMLFVLPALAVVAAAGAVLPAADSNETSLPESPRRGARVAVAVASAGIVLAQLAGLYVDALKPPHGDYGVREMAAVLTAEVGHGEPVFITPAELQPMLEPYWSGAILGLPSDMDLERLYEPYEPERWLTASIGRFTEHSLGAQRAWLVYTADRDAGGAFLSWVAERGTLSQRAAYELATLYVVSLR